MNISMWDLARTGMTFLGDMIVVLTLASAGAIFLGGILARVSDSRRPPRWTQRWEAFVVGFVCSAIGLFAKLGDPSGLPTGVILKLSNLAVGVLLAISLLAVVVAVALPSLRPFGR